MAAQILNNISIHNNSQWTSLLNMIYPVGSYYISNTAASPSSLFGGSWSQLTERFIYGTTNTNPGGSNYLILTVSQMPRHTHNLLIAGKTNWTTTSATSINAIGNTSIKYTNKNILVSNQEIGYNPTFSDGSSGTFTGGSQPYNNMPAYKGAYIWYRIS